MQREQALEKIAFHYLKQLTRDEATNIIVEFFNEPLKPSLREQLNLTAVLQWETHEPPDDLRPGNPIYRPVLIDKMKRPFRGATNEYLAEHLKTVVGLEVDRVEGDLPDWFATGSRCSCRHGAVPRSRDAASRFICACGGLLSDDTRALFYDAEHQVRDLRSVHDHRPHHLRHSALRFGNSRRIRIWRARLGLSIPALVPAALHRFSRVHGAARMDSAR